MALIVDCKSSSVYWNRNDITMRYFDDIKKYDLLTPSEEYELFEKIRNGNPEEQAKAREKIIQCNQRFIVSAARRWSTYNNLPDLINEANIGLMKAIDNFNHKINKRFLTYAIWWIRKELNSYLITKENVIKTKNAHKIYTSANRVRNEFYSREGRFPTTEEVKELIHETYNYDIRHNEDLYELRVSSIDETYSSDSDDASFTIEDNSDFAVVSATCNIDDDIEKDYEKEIISSLLSTLSEREQTIIKLLYGINEIREYNIDEVSEKMNISRERVRQLKISIIEKLKLELDNVKIAI